MTTKKCIFCENQAEFSWIDNQTEEGLFREEFFRCPHCGNYVIPRADMLETVFKDKTKDYSFYISCYLREKKGFDDIHELTRLTSSTLMRIVEQRPKTLDEKIDKLLTYINRHTHFFGEEIEVNNEVIYSQNAEEVTKLVKALTEANILESQFFIGTDTIASLTMQGYEYIKETQKAVQSNKCFIAMWFTDEMNKIYDEVIVPACIAAGYEPVRVDKELYNGDITDKIISLIRTTAFTIADYTGNRGGVYYEAGFAKGLGKEVIMTCREDWFNEKEKGHKVHFDVNHINMIVWNQDDLNKFKEDLTNRIIATIGKGSFENNSGTDNQN